MSPAPGARDASPATQLSMLGAPAPDLAITGVSGSVTGSHAGRLAGYSQGDGASFVSERPFAQGETVTVSAELRSSGVRFGWRFQVAEDDDAVTPPARPRPGHDPRQTFRSRPDLRPPRITVTKRARGYVFTAPYAASGQSGPMIFDESGRLVWFHPLPAGQIAGDLRVQRYRGRPALTWWESTGLVGGHRVGDGVIADGSYRELARVRAGNGYRAELHEFLLAGRDTALLTAYEPIRCDLSAIGAHADNAVWDTLLQEVDVATGLVRFEWHVLDHVALADSYQRVRSASPEYPYDWAHLNSIDVERDGSLLVSVRNTWTVYDVDRRSARVRWRLGGRHSSFRFPRGFRPAWQHDARERGGGRLTLFDNGAAPRRHRQSRGLVLALDRSRRAVRVRALLVHRRPLVSATQGNLQALADGWFVGWGQEPYFTEYDRGGRVVFDAHLPLFEEAYRAYRFRWVGQPVEPPAVAARGRSVYASWNGATQLSAWELLAGPTPARLRRAAVVPRSGFETRLRAPRGARFFEVVARDGHGRAIGQSGVVGT